MLTSLKCEEVKSNKFIKLIRVLLMSCASQLQGLNRMQSIDFSIRSCSGIDIPGLASNANT